jgi:hypothetical protein
MSSSNSSFIRGIPLGKRIIKLRELMICIRRESQMTLDVNDVTAVLIHLLSHSLAHAENAFERSFDERIMVSMARGRGSQKRWSWIKSRIPCSTGMERRRTWCITRPMTNVKGLMLTILGKSDLCDPFNHIHDIWSRWQKLLWIIHCPSQLIPNKIHDSKGSSTGHGTSKEIASKVAKCRGISILSINSGTKKGIHSVVVRLESACITGFS